jgi:hypothetical protein
VSAWQRELRTLIAGAPKTLKTKLEGQLHMGAGRAHNISNSFDTLISRLAEVQPHVEHVPSQVSETADSNRPEAQVEPAPGSPVAAEPSSHERHAAIRGVMSENGLALADVLTDRPTKPGEPGARLIVYRVNNITKVGDVIRDDREPQWMPTEYGAVKRPIIGSVPFATGGVTGTVTGAYKVSHIEVRPSLRSDKVVKRGITLNQQVREGNILYAYLAKREEAPT